MPSGLIPKRLAWQPLAKTKVKETMFSNFDLSKEQDDDDEIDFTLLSEMFCRKEEELKEEEEKKKAAKERQEASSTVARNVLEIKQINDIAMAMASLRVPASEIVDALIMVDDYSLSAE